MCGEKKKRSEAVVEYVTKLRNRSKMGEFEGLYKLDETQAAVQNSR